MLVKRPPDSQIQLTVYWKASHIHWCYFKKTALFLTTALFNKQLQETYVSVLQTKTHRPTVNDFIY